MRADVVQHGRSPADELESYRDADGLLALDASIREANSPGDRDRSAQAARRDWGGPRSSRGAAPGPWQA